jgi:hypothetical protein
MVVCAFEDRVRLHGRSPQECLPLPTLEEVLASKGRGGTQDFPPVRETRHF